MTIPFSVNGARAVIPAVYDYLRVQNSLPSVVPAGRNIFIFGEANSGIPSNLLDLQLNYFTDYNSVLAYYKSGPLVDAARQIFTAQPSVAFNGSVNRLYIYKTNNTTRAEKTISSPTNYGKIVAAVWDEDGNLIKSQIKQSAAEVLPTITAQFLPSASISRNVKVVVNGKPYTAALTAPAMPSDAVTAISAALTGATCTGGALRSVVSGVGVTLSASGAGSVITLAFGGTTNFSLSTVVVGDVLVIPGASGIKGATNGNCGAYIIETVTASSVSARKMVSWTTGSVDSDYTVPETATVVTLVQADQAAYATAEFLIYAPVTISVTEATLSGSGATLEIADATASNDPAKTWIVKSTFANIVSTNGITVGDVTATLSSGKLVLTLSNTILATIPAIGDIINIDDGSPIAGASKENVGTYLVFASSSNSLTLTPVDGSTIAAVAQTPMAGVQPCTWEAAFVTTALNAEKINSSVEGTRYIDASRTKDNAVWPTTSIGGNNVLEVSYYNASVTAAKLSIDYKRKLTIVFTGGSVNTITVNTLKYPSMKDLVEFLNTQTGLSARVTDLKYNSAATTQLDMVTNVNILSATAIPAYNGRIKNDYYSWKQSFADYTSGILAFAEGTMLLKCGLPTVESSAGYLSGATLGYSANADFQAGLDQAMKIEVFSVLPLVSRDAVYDIEDGLTDTSSSYTIDAIHAMCKAHVATASGSLIKKERYAELSFHGSFADTKIKCSTVSYERTSMMFQMARSVNSNGDSAWFLPWILGACTAAGRAQATLGTSLLRKSFNVSDIKHIGNLSIYSDTLVKDFEPEDQGELSSAIETGLLAFKFTSGFGVQLASPDETTRSREGDGQSWVWERRNVLMTLDVVRQTTRTTLENYIGSRTSDVAPTIISDAITSVLGSFITGGSLTSAKVLSIKNQGNQYFAIIEVTPTECLEAIVLEVNAVRNLA